MKTKLIYVLTCASCFSLFNSTDHVVNDIEFCDDYARYAGDVAESLGSNYYTAYFVSYAECISNVNPLQD
jgi:hypothetical protein